MASAGRDMAGRSSNDGLDADRGGARRGGAGRRAAFDRRPPRLPRRSRSCCSRSARGSTTASRSKRTLGRPTFISQFGEPVWYYVSSTTKQEPFRQPQDHRAYRARGAFRQGRQGRVGVEPPGVEKVARINPDSDKTPTLGRNRSFLQDLFGNIGQVGARRAGGRGGGGGGNPEPARAAEGLKRSLRPPIFRPWTSDRPATASSSGTAPPSSV